MSDATGPYQTPPTTPTEPAQQQTTPPEPAQPPGDSLPSSASPGSPPPSLPGNGDWRAAIPSELQEAPQLKDVKDVASLAKQFVDQQKFLGNSIRVPGEDAGPEAKQEFFAKLQKQAPELILRPDTTNEEAMNQFWQMAGVPADHNEYTVDESLGLDEKWLAESKPLAKRYGMTQEAYRRFAADYVQRTAEKNEQMQTAQAADMKQLNEEWGHATEARLNDIKKFAEVMELPASFTQALTDNQVGAAWLKPLWNIITQFGGLKEGQEVAFQPGGSIPDSPAEIEAQIAEIHGNPAFLNPRDPLNKSLVEKNFELTQKLTAARANN